MNVFLVLFFLGLADLVSCQKPNIILILLDDVGSSDLGYNSKFSPIPTPRIDSLVQRPGSIHFQQYYTHSLCTPTRAALLTGRYSINTGLNYVLVPGTPAGLPDDVITLPMLLKSNAGYRTAMSGKWHLGHAQNKQTPVGKGFDHFTGVYMWDTDSYTKQMFEQAWEPLAVDWVQQSANGSTHFAEPRHSTEAITWEAERVIIEHSKLQSAEKSSLFLYVAFTAAHSPLQPMPKHEEPCKHIPHLWRRQYCGMVVGLDEAIWNITLAVEKYLGENTVMVVSSDNGGSPWFGGMNYPFRGAKSTPFEGGVRVPAFLHDFSSDKRYFGSPVALNSHRVYSGIAHVSDWYPTLARIAGIDEHLLPDKMDGIDLGNHIRNSNSSEIKEGPRTEVLLELIPAEDAVFKNDMYSYRMGDWKYIYGYPRDPYWYSEPQSDRLNSSDSTFFTYFGEIIVRLMENKYGSGSFDTSRIMITHNLLHAAMGNYTRKYLCPNDHLKIDCQIEKLYNLSADPFEENNLALRYPEVVTKLKERLQYYKAHRPTQPKLWLQFSIPKIWRKTFVSGDCSMNKAIPADHCTFTHPWISDDEKDPWAMPGLVHSLEYADSLLHEQIRFAIRWMVTVVVGIAFVIYFITGRNTKAKP